jgi:hypothetical protein
MKLIAIIIFVCSILCVCCTSDSVDIDSLKLEACGQDIAVETKRQNDFQGRECYEVFCSNVVERINYIRFVCVKDKENGRRNL